MIRFIKQLYQRFCIHSWSNKDASTDDKCITLWYCKKCGKTITQTNENPPKYKKD